MLYKRGHRPAKREARKSEGKGALKQAKFISQGNADCTGRGGEGANTELRLFIGTLQATDSWSRKRKYITTHLANTVVLV